MKKWVLILASYYQLIKPQGRYYKNIYNKTKERELEPEEFKIANKYLLALKLKPNNFKNFDEKIEDLNIDYFVFSNNDFKKIIKFSIELNVKIKDIIIEETDNETREEFYQYFYNNKYYELIDFMDEYKIIINEMQLLYKNKLLRIYDSGIIWLENDFKKLNIIKNFLSSLLEKLR